MTVSDRMVSLRGAGGGGKSGGGAGRTPVEAPDSLQSRQSARVIDLLSEGEIFGLVDGLKSVYLDETPILNADGSSNFSGVTIEGRNGTQAQSYIPGFSSVEAENAVGVQVKASAPVVRSVSNESANALRVTISVPALSSANTSNGDISGSSVEIAIDLQTDGAGFVPVVADTITGKTTSKYQRAYRIELAGAGPWDVRVRRITADNTSSTVANDTYWDSYTEIVDAKLRYPNSAIQALSVQADAFTSIPKRGYEAKGMLVQYPSNYNPATRVYAGVWDGTWAYGWTNNPAWCFRDILVQNRYGLGDYLDVDQVDKWALYQIARYCDEIIDDGFGGTEPRYTCSLYLQTREEALSVIASMASVFCGIAFWASGAVVAAQDAPQPPVALFAPANVIGGKFSYSGSSLKSRHTVALVSWNDPADMYRQKIEYVDDKEGIARYGIRQTAVVAIGCTSRGQAHRFGRSLLYTERMETETVAFVVGLDGLAVSPGEVIQTTDPVRAGVRVGGRLLAATASSVTLDAPVTLSPTQTYALWVVLPDGTVQSRPVLEGTGVHDVLTVSPAFSAAPQAMAIWTLAASQLAPELWRVVSISEVDNVTAEIAALKYSPNKYAEIEQGIVLDALPTSTLNSRPDAPTDLTIVESSYPVTPGTLATRITLSWSGTAAYFELQYRRSGGNWQTLSTSTSSVDIQPAEAGLYDFALVAINSIGRRSRAVAASATIYGLDGPLGVVTGLGLNISDAGVFARWDPPGGLDAYNWQATQIREGATWEAGTEKFNGKGTTANIGWLQAGLRKVWAAHYNTVGQAGAAVHVDIQIDAPNQPIVTSEVARSTATLTWQDCTASQPIGTYLLRVGATFATATEFAQIKSTAFDRTEAAAGTYTYWVAGVDVAGNVGVPGNIVVTILPSIDDAIAELEQGLDDVVADLITLGGDVDARILAEAAARGTDIAHVEQLITDGDAQLAQQITTITARAGNGGNLVENSEFATDLVGWFIAYNTTTPVTMTRADPTYTVGKGTMMLFQEGGLGADLALHGLAAYGSIPVIAGRRYQASVYTGAHRCKVSVFIVWFNAAGATVSATAEAFNDEEAFAGNTLAQFKRIGVFGVAPAGATGARMDMRKYNTRSGVNSAGFFARPMFCSAATSQTECDEYAPGASYASAVAAISQEATVRASAIDAEATQRNTLATRVGAAEASVTTEANVRAGETGLLFAKYGIRLNVNGKVSGFIQNNNGTQSDFVILTDRFAVAQEVAGSTKYPFVVGLIDGVSSIGISGNMYVDGSIKTRMLEAEVVTADKIKANAVEAQHIKAGSVTADKIAVGVGSNLLLNSEFVSTRGWNVYDGSASQMDAANTGINKPNDAYRLRGGNTLATHQVGENQGPIGWYMDIPIQAGLRYEFSVYAASHRSVAYMSIEWLDGNNAAVSSSNTPGTVPNVGGGFVLDHYTRVSAFGSAPAGSYTARVLLWKQPTTPSVGAADSWAWFTHPYFGAAGAAQTAPSNYSPGGVGTTIGPEGITTPSLAALSLNAGYLTAGQLDINSDGAGGVGYVRSAGKSYGDANNGWIMARGADGSAYVEIKVGAGRLRFGSWGEYSLEMPGISMSQGGLTINQVSVIGTLQLAGQAVTVPTSATASDVKAVPGVYLTAPAIDAMGGVVNITVSLTTHAGNTGDETTGTILAATQFAITKNGAAFHTFQSNFDENDHQVSITLQDTGVGVATYGLLGTVVPSGGRTTFRTIVISGAKR